MQADWIVFWSDDIEPDKAWISLDQPESEDVLGEHLGRREDSYDLGKIAHGYVASGLARCRVGAMEQGAGVGLAPIHLMPDVRNNPVDSGCHKLGS